MRLALFGLMCGVVPATSAHGHYHMPLPDRHFVKIVMILLQPAE